jgi:hypothetical protein
LIIFIPLSLFALAILTVFLILGLGLHRLELFLSILLLGFLLLLVILLGFGCAFFGRAKVFLVLMVLVLIWRVVG